MRAGLLIHTADVSRRTSTVTNRARSRAITAIASAVPCRFEPLREEIRQTRLGKVEEATFMVSYAEPIAPAQTLRRGDLVKWLQADAEEAEFVVREIKRDEHRGVGTPAYRVALVAPYRGGAG